MHASIAVITPYCHEATDVLGQCHDSVMAQHVPADHFLVADGFPDAAVGDWRARHIVLPQAHGDNGNTPRAVGGLLAEAQGYEFIAYLDADNWFHADHLSSLMSTWEATRAPVVCAWRTFHRLDGTAMNVSEAEENACRHVDTSCYLIHRSAFGCLPCWSSMPRQLSPMCDRVFLKALLHKRYQIAFTRQRTVAFRSQYQNHYRAAGLEPPPGAKSDSVFEPCKAYLTSVAGIHDTVERLGFWPWY